MPVRTLITGGGGFIGSHLCDQLLAEGQEVRVLDNLDPQVHGEGAAERRRRPDYLDDRVELRVGDVRDRAAVDEALKDCDRVVHLAAAVGVGQSMYEVARYTEVNNLGTAVLMEALIERPVESLVVASSMSVYGEGAVRTADGRPAQASPRSVEQLRAGEWELHDADGRPLTPIPTDERTPTEATSVYALSKYDQERLGLILGAAYDIPTVALRFFNVYGPRQALSNPYTGVLAIFASRLLSGRPPVIFEDGEQRRDFVSVHDVAAACRLASEQAPDCPGAVLNVGSGRSVTINQIAAALAEILGRTDLAPEVSRRYRVGDIRHCFADISAARETLGFEPSTEFGEGLRELAEWLRGQTAEDRVDHARGQLEARGLVV
ncbi:NAD-dependent epimerase/dehydratase family protein [Alienimonas sp. DA493]|uniref:NAD-dependent epimerase/dehydratase family protein n=1 Tax=Alienimonas sp. DA493 TaxID=3373605 RepID=UPI0037552BDB